jgi:hypothetical protein
VITLHHFRHGETCPAPKASFQSPDNRPKQLMPWNGTPPFRSWPFFGHAIFLLVVPGHEGGQQRNDETFAMLDGA